MKKLLILLAIACLLSIGALPARSAAPEAPPPANPDCYKSIMVLDGQNFATAYQVTLDHPSLCQITIITDDGTEHTFTSDTVSGDYLATGFDTPIGTAQRLNLNAPAIYRIVFYFADLKTVYLSIIVG